MSDHEERAEEGKMLRALGRSRLNLIARNNRERLRALAADDVPAYLCTSCGKPLDENGINDCHCSIGMTA